MLDTITKECDRRGKSRYHAFLDIKGAYNSVDRSQLWLGCDEMGWDEDIIRLLKSLFDLIMINVHINDLSKTLRETQRTEYL